MADQTHIQWTDATWNPITGCSVVSAGCKNCYAMRLAGGRLRNHPSRAGLTRVTGAGRVWTGAVRFIEAWLYQPLRWRRPRRIFVCAHSDLFHPEVPDEWIDRVFAVMALAPQHTFQVLTKRPARMLEYFARLAREDRAMDGLGVLHGEAGPLFDEALVPDADWEALLSGAEWPLSNVWLGVSIEDQDTADERIPPLLETPAALRFVSAEPMLGRVDLTEIRISESCYEDALGDGEWSGHPREEWPPGIDWVIVGGESGRGARPCEVGWIRDIVRQCREARVPCFVKQLGHHPIVPLHELRSAAYAEKKFVLDESAALAGPRLVLRSRAGSDPAEWPDDLAVREFPPCQP